jgi:hypothetical protein
VPWGIQGIYISDHDAEVAGCRNTWSFKHLVEGFPEESANDTISVVG